jgi:hypothetical protein
MEIIFQLNPKYFISIYMKTFNVGGILMGEYTSSGKKVTIILGITTTILAIVVVLMFVNIIPTWNSNRAAKLVNVGLGSRDLGQDPSYNVRELRIECYVCNVGVETASKSKLHVVATYVTGGIALDQYVSIGDGGIIYGGESTKIELNIPYTGNTDLGSCTLTPECSQSP